MIKTAARRRNSNNIARTLWLLLASINRGNGSILANPLSPLGNSRLRTRALYAVLIAVRLNPWLRAYYLRLRAADKRPKIKVVAAMHKLLTAVYGVAKNRRPFRPHLSTPMSPPLTGGTATNIA